MELREIVFRGKRLDNGEWVYGDVQHNCDHEPRCISDYCGSNPVDPSTVGQYTGLKDKKGKRIFEGDIVEHHAQCDILVNRGVVNWDGKNARWAHQLNTMNPDFTFYNPDAYEVISNIHDHPELLKGEADA